MLKPMFDKVLVEKIDEDTQKIGVLYAPGTAVTTYTKGKVVATGTGRIEFGTVLPLSVAVDDIILFSAQQAVDIKVDSKSYLMVSERDIVAKF